MPLIFPVSQCEEPLPLVHSLHLLHTCKLWYEFKAKLLNCSLQCCLQTLPEAWLSGGAAHSPPSRESETLGIGLQYWACGTTSHCLTSCFSFSLFFFASGKSNWSWKQTGAALEAEHDGTRGSSWALPFINWGWPLLPVSSFVKSQHCFCVSSVR